ncbi:MAG TPA: acyltransferase [Vicinamibacterales bacterium]|nr:acyltransferase [Vicinamibacterales bacterium]
MTLKARVLARLSGRPAVDGAIDARWPELAAYAWQRGGMSRVRGLLLAARLGACGGRLFAGRHVRVLFPRRVRAGRNVLIGDHAYISAYGRDGIEIGSDVSVREHAWIQVTSRLDDPGVGLRIGDGTYIGPRCVLGAGGGIRIGRRVLFGANVQLLAEDHVFQDPGAPIGEQGVARRGIVIEDEAWIGNSAIVLDGVTVGRGAVIGAGAVVTRDVPAGMIAAGNPARVLRARGPAS